MITQLRILAMCWLGLALCGEALARTADIIPDPATSETVVFAPHPDPNNSLSLDYSVWDTFLYTYVLYSGPSTREYLRRPIANAGSRKYYGHNSPYRAEGNRLLFSQIPKDAKTALSDYKTNLLNWGEDIDITQLSMDEQLAYWANLHNVVLIEALAADYPVKDPAKFKPKGYSQTLHDAKLVTLRGVPLSLRDIRENIVFAHWNDPRVIYAFWTAEISGPSLNYTAFNGSNIWTLLDETADEFANSLRGFQVYREERLVSKFFADHARFYFPDFEADLMAHLDPYIRTHLRKDFNTSYPIKIDRYHTRIADIGGGYVPRLFGRQGSYDMSPYSPQEARMLQRFVRKREQLIRNGQIKPRHGVVIIEDIETVEDWETPEIQIKTTITFEPPEPEEDP